MHLTFSEGVRVSLFYSAEQFENSTSCVLTWQRSMKWSVFYSESKCCEYKDDHLRPVIGRSRNLPALRIAPGISGLCRQTTPISFCLHRPPLTTSPRSCGI